MSSPSPKSPDPSERSRKYDRQLRLWGEHGQITLESSIVCLVNATAVGCEVLKGLILPGVGGFSIIDGGIVTEDDLGVNFFLNNSYLGKSKANACMELLQELNPDVEGDFVDECIEYIMDHRPMFFETFNVVVASNLSEETLLKLSNLLWEANIPFVYCRSLGIFGSIRIQVKEHCVVEAHPDNRQYDLRLEEPFPALQKHLEATEVTSKVPWLLVLNKYFRQWSSKNNGRVPKTYKEKSELRELIENAMVNNDEENYEEAIKAVNTAFGAGRVPDTLKAIFDDDACINLDKVRDPFWIIVRAIKDFVQNDNSGYLPLAGILPDMTADTESYVNLQNIYRQQALQDADAVYRKYRAYIKELGLTDDTLTEKDVRVYCREAPGLNVFRGTKISDEYDKNSRVQQFVDDSEIHGTFAEIYMALRSYDRFLTVCGNIPGECYVENDTARLKTVASKLFPDMTNQKSVSDDMIHEICRYGGAEIHSVSAFIGGCAAHEIIKILTRQYKPIDNTFIYNGLTSETLTIRL